MMPLASRILLATDFSKEAERAQQAAVFLAKACGAEMDVLSVLECPPGMDVEYQVNKLYMDQLRGETGKRMDGFLGDVRAKGLTVTGTLLEGMPIRRINETAGMRHAGMIVVGTRGRSGLAHVLLGSTAEGVVRGAPCPVLTVRTEGADRPFGIARILVPIDFNDCSLEALEYAVQVAGEVGSAVTILHVLEPSSYNLDFTIGTGKKLKEAAGMQVASYATLLNSRGIKTTPIVHGGLPNEIILNYAREADLIVMGTHGRKGFSHLVSGSVAEAVIRQAPCPVLTVKSPRFGDPARRALPAPHKELMDLLVPIP
jgi:nucleotide-binding universal stress UspA family protein